MLAPIRPSPIIPSCIAWPLAEELAGGFDDPLGREPELPLQVLEGRGGAERVHADHPALAADVAVPPEDGRLLDADAGRDVRRNHLVAVLTWLALEQVPGRHADDT